MLSQNQLKFIEYLTTGHTVVESAKEVEISVSTARGWLKNPEVLLELSEATEIFAKEVLKSRSRQYRIIQKKILDSVLEKIEEGSLEEYSIEELIKMLDKSVSTARNDEDPKKNSRLLSVTNNTFNITDDTEKQFKNKEFVDKFSELLGEMSPDDIQQMAEAKEKADKDADPSK